MKSLLPALMVLLLAASGVQAQTSTGQVPKPIAMPTAPVPGARPDPDTLRDPAAAEAIKAAERRAALLEKDKQRQARKKALEDETLAASEARLGKAKAKANLEVEEERAMTRAERRAARKAARAAEQEAAADMTRAERRAARKAEREAEETQALSREERRAARKKARAEARAARLADKQAREEVILPTPARKAKPGVNDGSRP